MSAETVLFSALSGSPSVTAVVGTGASARIYPDAVPQDYQPPSIAWSRVETEFTTTIHSSVPIAEDVTLEVSCMTPDRTAADSLAESCRQALGGAGFRVIGRRADFDSDNEFRGTVLTVQHFATL